ncbi:MAG: FAD-dependent oxidoreductase [Methylovulum sp.]|nr:FAD-dependent oxidoreductase [Methylovulum sp.]
MSIDFLIVGQGLAGSLLAWELILRGYKIVVIDNGKESASQVAAGVINPVTGMRLVKSADVDVLLPVAKQCYLQLSYFFQQDFYVEKPMIRLFSSDSEFKQAQKRLNQSSYYGYFGDIYPSPKKFDAWVSPYGFVEQKQTGYLLTRPLLNCLKTFFIGHGCYQSAKFQAKDVQLMPVLRWKDITPKQIIFCEGFQATQNPWFSWLPFQPVKGEILTLMMHQSQLPDHIINYGNWLIPLQGNLFRIGATFDHKTLDNLPTKQGKSALLTALHAALSPPPPFTLTGHQANVRPCTLDKQPFIGSHPHYPQLAIFNGFGAKGSLQIPYYSQHFADSLSRGLPMPSSIQRHYATHFIG